VSRLQSRGAWDRGRDGIALKLAANTRGHPAYCIHGVHKYYVGYLQILNTM